MGDFLTSIELLHVIGLANPPVASGHEAITVDDTSGGVGLTAANYANAVFAFLTLETAQIRWTVDGTAPTTTIGHLLESGQNLTLVGEKQLSQFKAIRTGASSGSLKVTYFQKG